jgi:hypothetical protein
MIVHPVGVIAIYVAQRLSFYVLVSSAETSSTLTRWRIFVTMPRIEGLSGRSTVEFSLRNPSDATVRP